LTLWLGSEFADNSTLVMQLLTVGVLLNSFAFVPFGLIQSAGRPDLTAKLHLIELPFYLLLLWWMVGIYGIVGAAIAWVVRVAFDTLALFVMAHRLLPSVSPLSLPRIFVICVALFVLALGAMIPSFVLKGVFLLLVMLIFVAVVWFIIFDKDEKNMIVSRLRAIPVFN